MVVLAYNLLVAMRILALPLGLKKKRLKRIRFALIDGRSHYLPHRR